jgi:hypothetical protein
MRMLTLPTTFTTLFNFIRVELKIQLLIYYIIYSQSTSQRQESTTTYKLTKANTANMKMESKNH